MIIKKIAIIFISYYISNYLLIGKEHYDINHIAINNFKDERYRCIRYIDNTYLHKKIENKITNMINKYPYAKCKKYKDDYIEYIINKNKIIIYNTLINIIFYINIIFL
jgi:hypothetical protein